MTEPPSIDFIDHVATLVPINSAEFMSVIKFFDFRKLKKDQVLIRAGDLVKHTFWIKKGLVISTYTDERGKEHIIQFANEGCWVTDQKAFYHGQKATFNVVCLEETEVFRLSYNNREKLCQESRIMETFFRRKANDSFVKQQNRLLTYMTSNSRQRYDLFLQEYPGLIQRISKKVLAAYLGVSRETLSRFDKKPRRGKK